MVFADQGEIISGGNFHGEYPAKVRAMRMRKSLSLLYQCTCSIIVSAAAAWRGVVRQACDYLAIGVHEVASMSERRIERLVNPAYSELPAFLTHHGGLNSGFMIAHCTAAALGTTRRHFFTHIRVSVTSCQCRRKLRVLMLRSVGEQSAVSPVVGRLADDERRHRGPRVDGRLQQQEGARDRR